MSVRQNRPAEVQVGEKDITPAPTSSNVVTASIAEASAPAPEPAPSTAPPPTRVDNHAAARLAAESATHHYNFEPLLTKLFSSEKDLLDTIHAVFPKGVKVCLKDKWKDGANAGMHKKWRFVCECGGQPRRNFNGSPARRTKKIGCPFFINAFWSQTQRGPRITTASLYHLGHEELEVNQQALSALMQEQAMASTLLLQEHDESTTDPNKALIQKDVIMNSLKLKMDFHLKYMIANFPLEFVINRVNDFLSSEGSSLGTNLVISSGALLAGGSLVSTLGGEHGGSHHAGVGGINAHSSSSSSSSSASSSASTFGSSSYMNTNNAHGELTVGGNGGISTHHHLISAATATNIATTATASIIPTLANSELNSSADSSTDGTNGNWGVSSHAIESNNGSPDTHIPTHVNPSKGPHAARKRKELSVIGTNSAFDEIPVTKFPNHGK